MATEPTIKDHERSDAHAGWIFVVVLGLMIGGLSIHWILAGFLGGLKGKPLTSDRWEPIARAPRPSRTNAPYPRLQVSPAIDLESFRAREESELHSYGWVDRRAGKVRIPIQRAMDLVLAQGFAVRGTGQTDQVGPSPYELIQQRPTHRQTEIKEDR